LAQSAVSSGLSAASRVAGSLAARLGLKAIAKSSMKAHPGLLAAEATEVLITIVGFRHGLESRQVNRLSRLSGCITALGVGTLVGGPAGAAISLAAHASSSALGDKLVDVCRQRLSNHKGAAA
jgi:hypothetical protein